MKLDCNNKKYRLKSIYIFELVSENKSIKIILSWTNSKMQTS